jgi:hypothetical protein
MSDLTHIRKPSIIFNIQIHVKPYDPTMKTCFCCNSQKDFDDKFELYLNDAIKEGYLTDSDVYVWRTMKNNYMHIDHTIKFKN